MDNITLTEPMTRRDFLAYVAMKEILRGNWSHNEDVEVVSEKAYEFADAMITEAGK